MLQAAALLLLVAGETEPVAVGDGHVVVWRSHALSDGVHAGVERAFVMVHGTGRNAEDYFRWAMASTAAANRLGSTAVVAPHFKARRAAGGGDEVAEGEWFWSSEGWKSGEAAMNGAAFSYDVVDRLLELFNDAERWPGLKEVVVAGHSAGGQFVQRYAVMNRMEQKVRLAVRYVVANPSSYVYLDGDRPKQGTLCTDKGECAGGFARYWDAANCTTYDHYRYGLQALTGYAAQPAAEDLKPRYLKRRVTYLVGELDVRTDDPNLDKTCPAQAQGATRRERGLNYWNYVKALGAAHAFAIAPGCGHSAVCVFAGPAGVRAVFGGGN